MKRLKKVLLVIVIVFVFLTIVGLIAGIQDSKKNTSVSEDNQLVYSKTTLGKALELTEEQETAMVNIFTQCGIGEIVSASQFQAGDDHTSYWLYDSETKAYNDAIVIWITNSTKTLESIYYGDYDIYTEGNVIAQITDYYVNSEDRDSYRVSSQMLVNKVLTNPETAQYPAASGWKYGLEDDIVIVQSSVTSENSLGIEATIDFQVKWQDGNPISLIIDGKEYIE